MITYTDRAFIYFQYLFDLEEYFSSSLAVLLLNETHFRKHAFDDF